MAELPEDKDAVDEFADELDSMLDENSAVDEQQDELIDDEDAIDRLLMDNAFGGAAEVQEDEFAEIDELISDNIEPEESSVENDIIDEFADDEDDLIEAVDKKINSIEAVEEEQIVDEFSEPDELEVEPERQEQVSADFDISSEEDELEITEQSSANQEVIEPAVAVQQPAPPVNIPDFTDDIRLINQKLTDFDQVHQQLNQRITSLDEKQDPTEKLIEELDGIQTELKKLRRKVAASEEKKPVMAIVALSIAIIALLVGGILGFMGFSANSKVKGLNEVFIEIEEQVEVLQEQQDKNEEVKKLSTQIVELKKHNTQMSESLNAMQKQFDDFSQQEPDSEFTSQLEQLNAQHMQTAGALEAVQLQVLDLENNAASSKKRTKKAIVKSKWQVNLVSFKQEWYANRKAQEFEKQGVPVEVNKIKVKGNDWYRLRIKGFKSKYEAAAYAARVKKQLNLTSVWVAQE